MCKCSKCNTEELGDGLPEYCAECYRQALISGVQHVIEICNGYIEFVNDMDARLALMSLRDSLETDVSVSK